MYANRFFLRSHDQNYEWKFALHHFERYRETTSFQLEYRDLACAFQHLLFAIDIAGRWLHFVRAQSEFKMQLRNSSRYKHINCVSFCKVAWSTLIGSKMFNIE